MIDRPSDGQAQGASPGKRVPKKLYESELYRLQAELVQMQEWIKQEGHRLVVVFEGRDAGGKGSAIKRITEYLNPRVVSIVALPAPSDRERTQWYFQRYLQAMPAAGQIRLFDRSWYNRAGVERVMGFCSHEEYRRFLHQAPIVERLLVEDGIMLRKYWFSVSDEEQLTRFRSRLDDPMRRWKLSPMDMESITRWEDYSRAKDEMLAHTDSPHAPWSPPRACPCPSDRRPLAIADRRRTPGARCRITWHPWSRGSGPDVPSRHRPAACPRPRGAQVTECATHGPLVPSGQEVAVAEP